MIRRENLAALIEAYGGTTSLGDRVGKSPSQLGDMIAEPPRKSFGEKVARDIEEKLGLPRGWLDDSHDPEELKALRRSWSDQPVSATYLAIARKREAEALKANPADFSNQARRVAKALDEIPDNVRRSEICLVLLDVIDELKGKP